MRSPLLLLALIGALSIPGCQKPRRSAPAGNATNHAPPPASPAAEPKRPRPAPGPLIPANAQMPQSIIKSFSSLPPNTAIAMKSRTDFMVRLTAKEINPLILQAAQFAVKVLKFAIGIDVSSKRDLARWGLRPEAVSTLVVHGEPASWQRTGTLGRKVMSDRTQVTLPMGLLYAKIPTSLVNIRWVLPVTDAAKFFRALGSSDSYLTHKAVGMIRIPGQSGRLPPELGELAQFRPMAVVDHGSSWMSIAWAHEKKVYVEQTLFIRKITSRRHAARLLARQLLRRQAGTSSAWMAKLLDPTADISVTIDGQTVGTLGWILGQSAALRSLGGATPEEVRHLSELGSKIAYLAVKLIRDCSPLFNGFGFDVRERKGRLSARLRWRLTPAGQQFFPKALAALGGANLLQGDRFVSGFFVPIAKTLKQSIPARGLFKRPFSEFAQRYSWAGFFAHFLLLSGFWPDVLRYEKPQMYLGLIPATAQTLGLRTGRAEVSDQYLTLTFK